MPNDLIRKRISSGSKFESLVGYSRAVVLPDPGGDWVFVSGTTGFNYESDAISDSVEEQTRQCFKNIAAALNEAGASLSHMLRIRIILVNAEDFDLIAPIIGEHCQEARPTNTTIVAGLVDPRMKIEIEVTARLAPA